MTSLIEFLEARLDEDMAIAKAAIRHPSKYNRDTGEFDRTGTDTGEWRTDSYTDPNDQCMIQGAAMTIYDEGGHTPEQATHIARHDPARVLRTVKAHRSILSQYRLLLPFDLPKSLIDMLELNIREIARIYADHPDFQAEWAA